MHVFILYKCLDLKEISLYRKGLLSWFNFPLVFTILVDLLLKKTCIYITICYIYI